MKGIWIIGDVHGCYRELEELLKLIPSKDFICFVGDLIDRGPESKDVVELVLKKYKSVLGNHELMAIQQPSYWMRNGGGETLKSFGNKKESLINLIKEKMSIFKYYEFDNVKPLLITHSEGTYFWLNDKNMFSKEFLNEDNPILWSRPFFKSLEKEQSIFNIFGHTALKDVFINHSYGIIDTGCVYGGKLSAMHYPSFEVISVNSGIRSDNDLNTVQEYERKEALKLAMIM